MVLHTRDDREGAVEGARDASTGVARGARGGAGCANIGSVARVGIDGRHVGVGEVRLIGVAPR